MVRFAAAASVYASRSTVSVAASTSEGRSMTAAPSADRTLRRSPAVAIATSFETRDELDHPPRSVGAHVHVVDHVLDQEETPAARLLFAGELRLEIRPRGLGHRAVAAAVRDADEQLVVGRQDLHADRHVLTEAIAVLDGVHRGFADRRLDPREPGHVDAGSRDRLCDAVH